MPRYMLLLYAGEADSEERARREAEVALWMQFTEDLTKAGLLVSTDRLHPADVATTVRVRDGETELTDGPFAVTKEMLGGYYVLECRDLDEALRRAERVPLARYGSVEVRPIVDLSAAAPDEAAASA
jgi:hypothetical protein